MISSTVQKNKNFRYAVIIVFILFTIVLTGNAQNTNVTGSYFTIENYYKAKWGHADEFINLYIKNHYPLLKKLKEKGDLISIIAEKPRLHSGEDTRWDFKVTLVFKNAQLAFDETLTNPYKKQLYPDQEKLLKDEQYRFSLLLAHWDVMVESVELNR